MKKLLSLGVCAILSLSFEPALAQQNQGSNALPSIPSEHPPTQAPAQGNINSGNVSEKDMRKMINPLEIIKQQEQKKKESNKTNSWVNPKYKNITNDENAKPTDTELSNTESQNKPEKVLPHIEEKENQADKTEVNVVKTEAPDQVTPDNNEAEKNAAEAVAENKRVIGNNPDTQDNKPQPKEENKKYSKEEAILKYKTAIKNIEKPQKPKRLWSLD